MDERYLQDLMIRMAHHSTAIEGNSLTLGETTTLLLEQKSPARPVNLREIYEVRNYQDLMPYLEEHWNEDITLGAIQDINRILMRDIDERGGKFKTIPNAIVGADFIPTPPYMVPEELKKWTDDLKWRMENTSTTDEKTAAIMEQHLRFERIHPFVDGNGRTGRALIVWSCMQQQIPPIVIEKEQRPEYIGYMRDNNAKGLTELAYRIQKQEIIRMNSFQDEHQPDQKDLEEPEKKKRRPRKGLGR